MNHRLFLRAELLYYIDILTEGVIHEGLWDFFFGPGVGHRLPCGRTGFPKCP